MAKILNYDPQTGITDYFEGDGKGGFTIHYHKTLGTLLSTTKNDRITTNTNAQG